LEEERGGAEAVSLDRECTEVQKAARPSPVARIGRTGSRAVGDIPLGKRMQGSSCDDAPDAAMRRHARLHAAGKQEVSVRKGGGCRGPRGRMGVLARGHTQDGGA